MSDLISRADAIEAIESRLTEQWIDSDVDYNNGIQSAIAEIKALPSAEAEQTIRHIENNTKESDLVYRPSAEAVQGEWIYHMTEGVVETISCNQCFAWYDITIPEQMATFNFCPNCGAKMKGGEQNDGNQR